MSQTPEDLAREANLTEDSQLGDIVARFPSTASVFESFRLNYWSRGKRRLGIACKDQGLDPDAVLALVYQYIEQPGAEKAKDWSSVSLGNMVEHVLAFFHQGERRELVRIENLLKVVLDEYRQSMPQIRLLYEEFLVVKQGDTEHMDHEEALLFPLIEQINEALHQEKLPAPFAGGSVAAPIRKTEYEHDLSSIFFKKLRDASESYRLPAEPTENLKALYRSLIDLEANIHRHIHFENWILHPAAVRGEARLLSMQF